VPNDIELTDGKGTFTATVTYDTLDLYGKVEASRKITVEAE
jgi:hypothetical protein